MSLDWLWGLAGLALIGLAAVDLFRTVLDYDGYGAVSRGLYRATWRAARSVASALPDRAAKGLLATAGPLMLLGSIGMWVVLTWVGFALIYLPAMPGAFSATVPARGPLLDSLYFSATSLSTVGFGDIVALHPVLRIASAFQALIGFGILTLTISYVLNVYQVLASQSALAAMIDDQTDASADPLDLAVSLLRHSDSEAQLDQLHRQILAHNEGLHRFPIVYYFRRRLDRRSAAYILRMVGEAAADLRWSTAEREPVSGSSSLQALLAAIRRVTHNMRDRFLDGDAREAAGPRELRSRYRRAANRLGGSPRSPDADARYAAWAEFMAELDGVTTKASVELAVGSDELGDGGSDREAPR